MSHKISANADALNESGESGIGGHAYSNQSSRRSSVLAPLPDVDFDENEFESRLGVELKDMEEDSDKSPTQKQPNELSSHFYRPSLNNLATGKPFTLELATNLKVLLFGASNKTFTPGWMGQSFNFRKMGQYTFGISQKRGGPCGILAAVQAYVLKALIFGTELDDTTRAVEPLVPNDYERNKALAVSLVSILDKCSPKGTIFVALPSIKPHFIGIGRYKSDGVTENLKMHEFRRAKEALAFVQQNIGYFNGEGTSAVISFLYSALVTRGLNHVARDMDTPDVPMMGAHGYCSQEMVNLMLTGKAVSNTFDFNVSFEDGDSRTLLKVRIDKTEVINDPLSQSNVPTSSDIHSILKVWTDRRTDNLSENSQLQVWTMVGLVVKQI